MMLDVSYLLRHCYMPCVLTYFGRDVFDRHSFLKNVYDKPENRNANVKSIYMFSDGHNFNTTDAELFLLKNGLVILPLFLPANLIDYGGEGAVADAVLTVYSPMLVGLWDRAAERMAGEGAPVQAVEVYVQWDCAPLRKLRDRVNDRLFNMTYAAGGGRMFRRMADDLIDSVSRTGKATIPGVW